MFDFLKSHYIHKTKTKAKAKKKKWQPTDEKDNQNVIF